MKRLFRSNAREQSPQPQTADERIAELIAQRMGDFIDHRAWDHACPICAWPWKPVWHRRPESYMAWSSCEACFAVAMDARAQGPDGEVALVAFIIAERELAEWLIDHIRSWPVWEGDPLDAGLPGYSGYRPAEDWDQRCPACRAAWREAWWAEGSASSSCQICFSAMAYRFNRREPVWLDMVPYLGFRVSEREDVD